MSDNLHVRPEGGEHPFIRLIDGPPRPCWVCGMGADGDRVTADGVIPGRRFVELKVQANGDGPVMPGALITTHDEPGRTVMLARDPNSGQAATVSLEHPLLCSECASAVVRALTLADTVPLTIERNRERQRADEAERRIVDLEAELSEVKAGLRAARPLLKILEVEKGTDRPPKRAAKPTTKEAGA